MFMKVAKLNTEFSVFAALKRKSITVLDCKQIFKKLFTSHFNEIIKTN